MRMKVLVYIFFTFLILLIPASLLAWEPTKIILSEAAIMFLLGSGLVGMGLYVRRKSKKSDF